MMEVITEGNRNILTDKPIEIRTLAGIITVGVFDNEIQVVRIIGDVKTTMVKFNDRSLL